MLGRGPRKCSPRRAGAPSRRPQGPRGEPWGMSLRAQTHPPPLGVTQPRGQHADQSGREPGPDCWHCPCEAELHLGGWAGQGKSPTGHRPLGLGLWLGSLGEVHLKEELGQSLTSAQASPRSQLSIGCVLSPPKN